MAERLYLRCPNCDATQLSHVHVSRESLATTRVDPQRCYACQVLIPLSKKTALCKESPPSSP